MTHRIAIIGSGALGSALQAMVITGGHECATWDVDPTKTRTHDEIDQVVGSADMVLLCIPTNAIRDAAQRIVGLLSKDVVVVSLSKGLERETGLTVDQLLVQLFPGRATALLSGPMLAVELTQGHLGAGVLATEERTTYDRVAAAFASTNLVVEYSGDVRGVAWCGVLKNVYAVGLGLAHGLGLGDNARGWLMTHALQEMSRLLPMLGGQAETLFTTAGVGDFIATALSTTSRNHQYGMSLARGETPSYLSEGAIALPVLAKHVQNERPQLPVLAAVSAVVENHRSARAVFQELRTELSG